MRTKTLLTALAALAAGITISNAQVYSANVVGYASVASATANANYLMNVPFDIGASNGVNEVFASNLPSGTSILIWNQTSLGYDGYVYDTSDPDGFGPGAPVWYLGDDATPADPLPTLLPGKGFFMVPSAPVTNVFSGAIAVNVGTSNNMVLATANANYLVGSVVPYAGAITNGSNSTGGANLNNLPSGTSILVWNQNTLGYDGFIYDTSDPDGFGPGAPVWYQGDDATPTDPPVLSVGQGFFIVPSGTYTWTTGL